MECGGPWRRGGTIKVLKERMKLAARFGPLFIAPEGVTTNGKSVVGRPDTRDRTPVVCLAECLCVISGDQSTQFCPR